MDNKEYVPLKDEEWKALSYDEKMEESLKYWESVYGNATAGMWCIKGVEIVILEDHQAGDKAISTSHICMIDSHQNDNHWNDRKFLLVARNAFPKLIAEIRRLQKE